MESIEYYKNDEWGFKIINDYLRDDKNVKCDPKIEKHIQNIDLFTINPEASKQFEINNF